MNIEDFDLLTSIIRQRSGLVLTKEKAYLLESRLMPVARKWNLKTLDDLAIAIRARRDEAMIFDVVEAMTTNETSFMRDQKPFDSFMQVVLPRLLASRASSRRIRIWSAASSTGQEAYSLAMLLLENQAKWQGWQIDIVGTDLSRDVVEKARAGIYTQFEVQRGLPITMLVKYFTKNGDKWQLKDNVRQMANFIEGNLLHDLPPQFGPLYSSSAPFDVVFCRNVLIYFDMPTKTKVLEATANLMAPDGVLYLGGAETVLGITNRFKPVEGQRGLYMKDTPQATSLYANLKTGAA